MPKLNGMSGPYPEDMVDKFEGQRCVIVAGGRCVWDDMALLGVQGDANGGWHVLAVNDMVMHYPGAIKHHYSNDHRMMPHWLAARRPLYVRKWGPVKYTHSCRVGGKYSWPWPGHGTSTLNAVYTALALGYSTVVICGAPLDNSGHYFDPPWIISNFENEVGLRENGEMMYWAEAKKRVFGGKVFAMSGRTRTLLGAP
jgi:hypothetical protein